MNAYDTLESAFAARWRGLRNSKEKTTQTRPLWVVGYSKR
jgi:hypothetical protein